jgi:hypothetical protein
MHSIHDHPSLIKYRLKKGKKKAQKYARTQQKNARNYKNAGITFARRATASKTEEHKKIEPWLKSERPLSWIVC